MNFSVLSVCIFFQKIVKTAGNILAAEGRAKLKVEGIFPLPSLPVVLFLQ